MQLSEFRLYFRYANLGIHEVAAEHFKVDAEMAYTLRQLDYWEQWRTSLTEKWFHFLLEDRSFFVFSDSPGKSSYSYYPCPLDVPSPREYLNGLKLEVNQRNLREHKADYDLILETATLKPHVLPIRYDDDPPGYQQCVHPTAHIHIGLDNNLRIATRRRLSPLAFVLFIIRQHYPENWAKLLSYSKELRLMRKMRDDLATLVDPEWAPMDEMQHYLA